MHSAQIDCSLRHHPITRHSFAGVYARDHLLQTIKARHLPAAYVMNTDPSDKPGQHWVAVYFPPLPDSRRPDYFDSYGLTVPADVRQFLKRHGHDSHRVRQNAGVSIQGPLTTVCGQYCIYFLAMRCNGRNFDEIMTDFDPNNLTWNDSMVAQWVNRTFKYDLPTADYRFLIQSCLPKPAGI